MTDIELKKLAKYIVTELHKRPVPRPRRGPRCGTASRMPECWGGTIYDRKAVTAHEPWPIWVAKGLQSPSAGTEKLSSFALSLVGGAVEPQII